MLARSRRMMIALAAAATLGACAISRPISPELVDALVIPARGATPRTACAGIDDLPLRLIRSDLPGREAEAAGEGGRFMLAGRLDADSASSRIDNFDEVVTSVEAEGFATWLEGARPGHDLMLGIHSPGGSLSIAGDIMNAMMKNRREANISTIVAGLAASGAALISAAGSNGYRYAMENSVYVTHTGRFLGESVALLDPSDIERMALPEDLLARMRANPAMRVVYDDLPDGSPLKQDLKLVDLYMRRMLYHVTPRELSDLCLASLLPEDGSDVMLTPIQALRLGFVDAVVVDRYGNGIFGRAGADDRMWVRDDDPRGGGRSLLRADGP